MSNRGTNKFSNDAFGILRKFNQSTRGRYPNDNFYNKYKLLRSDLRLKTEHRFIMIRHTIINFIMSYDSCKYNQLNRRREISSRQNLVGLLYVMYFDNDYIKHIIAS